MVTEDSIYERKMDGYSINSPILAIIGANQYLYLPQHILYYKVCVFLQVLFFFFFLPTIICAYQGHVRACQDLNFCLVYKACTGSDLT